MSVSTTSRSLQDGRRTVDGIQSVMYLLSSVNGLISGLQRMSPAAVSALKVVMIDVRQLESFVVAG